MAKYAWLSIDKFDTGRKVTFGPRDITAEQKAQLKAGKGGEQWRMLDDDGEVMAEGRIIGDYWGFEPLDDWGRGNYGATEIQYLLVQPDDPEPRLTWVAI